MQATLIKIGNSQGVRIPKPLIEMCHLEQKLEFIVTENGLLIAPKIDLREGWAEQFKAAIANGDEPEGDLFAGMGNKFDEEEWTW